MASPTQHRSVLHAFLGFGLLASLGLMQVTWRSRFAKHWRIRGATNGLQRQLRSIGNGFVNVLAEEPSNQATLFSAMNASRCVYLLSEPRKGRRLRMGECSEGKVQPTKFLLPGGNSGTIKLAEDPSLCLDAPGGGLLQLWSCDADSTHLDFRLHPEPPGWTGVPHFDLADRADAENMDASDLEAVADRAEELGYEGFSVFNGRAFLKKINHHLYMKELEYMGTGDPCVFYLRRYQSGDVSVRLAAQPDTCLHASTSPDESELGMAPCIGENQSVNGGAWAAGMVFRTGIGAYPVLGGIKSSTGDDNSEKESIQPPALQPTATPRPRPVETDKGSHDEEGKKSIAEGGGDETNSKEPDVLSRLIIVLNVENVDYGRLQTNAPLMAKFKNVIQEDVTTMAGLGHDHVDVELGPGSVRAINTLTVPETSKTEDVRSKLQLDLLSQQVASNIKSVPGIDDVSTGNITVVSFETTGQEAGLTFPPPLAIVLGIILLLAVVVVVVFVMVRGKRTRTLAPVLKAPENDKIEEEESTLEEKPAPLPAGDDGPAINGGNPESHQENDRLLGEPNENEEPPVLTEEHEERQEKVAGMGEEEEAPIDGDSQPPAAAAAPADDEDLEMKAALAASLQDTEEGTGDVNKPVAVDTADRAAVPGADLSGY